MVPYKRRVYKRPPNRSAWLNILKGVSAGAGAAIGLARKYKAKGKIRRGVGSALKRTVRRVYRRSRVTPRRNTMGSSSPNKRVLNDWGSTNRSKGGPSNAVMLYRALQTQMDKTIFYVRGVNAFGTPSGGFYKMNFGPNGESGMPHMWQSPGTNASLLPIYALSLNGAIQSDDLTPESIKRMVCYTSAQAGVAQDAGIRWNQCSMQTTAGGTLGASYLLETSASQSSSANVASNAVGQKALCAWQQVKLNLYGCKLRPVKYQILIVQFYDKDVFDPFVYKTDASNTGQMLPEAQQFYQEWIKQLTWNPIDKVNVYNAKKHYRVLHAETITIDPPKTIDQDQVPNVHTWKYFVRPGQICNFADYASLGGDANRPVVDDVNFRDQPRSDIARTNQNYPSRHTVMFISANDFAPESTTEGRLAWSSDQHGSFDAYLRTCWMGNRYA